MNMRSDLLNEAVCPQVGWEWTYRSQGHLGIWAFLFDLGVFSMLLCSSLHYHLPPIKPCNLGCCVSPVQSRGSSVPDPARPSTQAGAEAQNYTKWLGTRESATLACLNGSFLTPDFIAINIYKIYNSSSQILLWFFKTPGNSIWNCCYVSFCLVLQSYKYKCN